jgi:hypothetical protein
MIDNARYIREADVKNAPKPTGKIKIVILQRGWCMVGYFSKEGEQCKLENAAVIRRWGTIKGLGELALKGPLSQTVLDPCGVVTFNELTTIAMIDCEDSKWESQLV